LALTSVADPSSFGLIETGKDGAVRSFVEKPSPDQINADTINAGCYLFEPSLFAEIPAGRAVSVEREVFPALLRRGRRLFGYRHAGYWSDVGTLKAYLATHADLLREHARWDAKFDLGAKTLRHGVRTAPGAKVDRTATVRGHVFLGRGSRVGAGALLEGFVSVGAGAVIEDRAVVTDSVLHAGARVGEGARVESSLVGEKARIGAACQVGPGMALARGSVLGGFTRSFSLLEKASENR
jgi:mannose-1-phosphate guanylyltransferase